VIGHPGVTVPKKGIGHRKATQKMGMSETGTLALVQRDA